MGDGVSFSRISIPRFCGHFCREKKGLCLSLASSNQRTQLHMNPLLHTAAHCHSHRHSRLHGTPHRFALPQAQIRIHSMYMQGEVQYLVGHGGRAHFVFLDGLGEVVEADIGPHVAAKVGQNRVDPRHAVAVGRHVVVVRDLKQDVGSGHAWMYVCVRHSVDVGCLGGPKDNDGYEVE